MLNHALGSLFSVASIRYVTLLVFMLSVWPSAMAAESSDYESLAPASDPFVPVRVVDTDSMPIESRSGSSSWGAKTLFEAPSGGHLQILYIPPGAKGALNHYHEFHEWAWIIYGDFTNNESTHPDQVFGPLQRFVAGDFLSRPPFSLHGGERGRQEFMASQIGSVIMIMEEGPVREQTFRVDPACRQGGACPTYSYNADYKEIKHWAVPRIIDTLNDMPFQPMKDNPGLSIKYLVDDPLHGFRATMWYLEAGADTPEMMRPHYYEKAHQFNFLINGDLTIQAYRDSETASESYTLTQHFLVERRPMSAFGLVSESATKDGAVWLEVTYSEGTSWTDEYSPIEEPKYISP